MSRGKKMLFALPVGSGSRAQVLTTRTGVPDWILVRSPGDSVVLTVKMVPSAVAARAAMDSEADFFATGSPAMLMEPSRQRPEPAQTGGDDRMIAGAFVSKLSVVAAYVVFAFVGAIVLGVF
jgi:hypothetical protein